MREAVAMGQQASEAKDWKAVGTANMMFHKAVVELADSPRLEAFYAQISAELRLAFGLLDDPRIRVDVIRGAVAPRRGQVYFPDVDSTEDNGGNIKSALHHHQACEKL